MTSTSHPSPSSTVAEREQTESTMTFWCHACQEEIQVNSTTDLVCPHCQSDFLEKIETENDSMDHPRHFLENPSLSEDLLENWNEEMDSSDDHDEDDEDEDEDNEDHEDEVETDYRPLPQNRRQRRRTSSTSWTEAGTRTFRNALHSDETPGFPSLNMNTMINLLLGPSRPSEVHPSRRTGNTSSTQRGSPLFTRTFTFQGMGGLPGILQSLFHEHSPGMLGEYILNQRQLDNFISQLLDQEGFRNAPPPAPPEVVDALPRIIICEEDKMNRRECPICMDEFQVKEAGIRLPCMHVFHEDCLVPWIKTHGTCPVCRLKLTLETVLGRHVPEPSKETPLTTQGFDEKSDPLLHKDAPTSSSPTDQS